VVQTVQAAYVHGVTVSAGQVRAKSFVKMILEADRTSRWVNALCFVEILEIKNAF
jgi:hypothetical protein